MMIFFRYISIMKPPARNAKPPSTFEFDSSHVLGAQRVSKHRTKKQERDKKRKMRDENSNLKETETGTAAVEASNVGSESTEVEELKNDSKKSKK